MNMRVRVWVAMRMSVIADVALFVRMEFILIAGNIKLIFFLMRVGVGMGMMRVRVRVRMRINMIFEYPHTFHDSFALKSAVPLEK